jgi:hypothetical protein
MNKLLFGFLFLYCIEIKAQELFVFTEPASNMPANSIGLRIGQSLLKEQIKSGFNYHIMPEIMWGINKNLMVHASAFLSNRNNNLISEGGSFYAKYRFFSVDDLQSHFRLAAIGRYSFNKADIHQEEIETMGHNTGFETGIIATQLIKKLAISTSVSYEKATDNKPNYDYPLTQSNNATNYTLGFGKLVYPKKYVNFKQTNINLMVEFLGQILIKNKKSYFDVAPSIQFIINSQARIDFAYKQELYSSMLRSAPNGFYLKLEYTFFSIRKNK